MLTAHTSEQHRDRQYYPRLRPLGSPQKFLRSNRDVTRRNFALDERTGEWINSRDRLRRKVMTSELLLYIDWNCGRLAVKYRNQSGDVVVELTDYPASMPSLVVSDAIQKSRPESPVLAKLS